MSTDQHTDKLNSRLVDIKTASELIPYTQSAIRTKIARGVWLEGREYIRTPDKRVFVDLEGFERWARAESA